MKIASDVAEVIAYMHYSMSMPILYRILKTTKILLDEEYTAKVSGFATSDLVPEDQDQVSVVINKRGNLDPDYLYTNMQTEKSGVYSFGVVLAELLKSKVAYSYDSGTVSVE
ncbi:putative wall-associated receptor kinase-like 16 [Malus domestica]|uniref:putative wall-associated receptor kinase-like 16 n=1 Tax=Malus domestica TaxID=3750 RepID=UPI0039759196